MKKGERLEPEIDRQAEGLLGMALEEVGKVESLAQQRRDREWLKWGARHIKRDVRRLLEDLRSAQKSGGKPLSG